VTVTTGSSRRSVVERVRDQARRTPSAVALEFDDERLTYAELDARTGQVAAHLAAMGAGRETLVAIALDRSLDMVVAVLGVHRAGAAYLPLDPSHPAERIAFMLEDSGAAIVVTSEDLRAGLPPHANVVSIDALRTIDGSVRNGGPTVAKHDDLAYVIYTSGSTGRPKGVQIEHGNLANLLDGIATVVPLALGDVVVAIAPLAFDISGFDLFATLSSGARTVIAPRETVVNPKALIALIERSGATHVQATPATWRMLLDAGWSGGAGMTLISTGEALPPRIAERLLERSERVWNLYGPTETTIWATFDRVLPGEPITIGRALPGVATYVLDEKGARVAPGTRGELFIGGHGVARGYLNRPELSAERFVADPFAGVPGARMYRTGDVASVRDDGRIDFFGRSDFQVKVRGYRIELGEIEAALEARDEIRSAVVAVRADDESGESALVAYVTVRPYADVTSSKLRRELLHTLPAYMIPDAVVVLDTLPVNANGKIDRTNLPAPLRGGSGERASYEPPRTELETQLTAIWEDVLDVRPIGRTDDFFELGVTSIVAARLFHRIETELGAQLPLSPLFTAPTIEKLAALIESGTQQRSAVSLVPIQPLGSRTPIFCVHGGAGTILHLQPIAKRLGAEQPFYGFQIAGLYGHAAPPLTVEGMAEQYVREMRSVRPAGPYVLAGYCFGGMVAYEMAVRLRRAGEHVALVISFNGTSPSYIQRYGNDVRNPRVPGARKRPTLRSLLGQLTPRELKYRLAFRRRVNDFRDRLAFRMGRPVPPLRRERAFLKLCADAEARYRAGRYDGPMLLVQAEGMFREPTLGWTECTGGTIESIVVPGYHEIERDTMREPHVSWFAPRLREALERYVT